MKIEFITEKDATGLGRIVVNDRFYGLPVEVVEKFKSLEELCIYQAKCNLALQDALAARKAGQSELVYTEEMSRQIWLQNDESK